MKVTAILKGRTDAHGRQSIYIRIHQGSKRTFTATKMKVRPEQFEKGVVVNHPNQKLFNENIRQKLMQAEMDQLKGVRQYPDADFREYVARCIRNWGEKKKATITIFETERDKFLDFTGDIKLSRITVDLLNDYKGHLYGKGYAGNTVWKSFKTLKAIVSHAVEEKVIGENPFDLFRNVTYRDPDKYYLTPEQIEAIDRFSLNEEIPHQLRHVATWFLIGCHTGLRHSDKVRFNKDQHLVNGRLVMSTQKTYDVVSFPVKGKLQELLERVGFKALGYTNQKYNEHLKTVASVCGIKQNLTGHISRHTFAVRCSEAGINPEVTAKLMGVKSLKTVAIYYRITGHRMDEELGKLY